jgi:hypothetical protein
MKNRNGAAKRAEGLHELAASFGVSYDVLWRAAKDRRIKTLRFGGRVVVPVDEIARLERDGLEKPHSSGSVIPAGE